MNLKSQNPRSVYLNELSRLAESVVAQREALENRNWPELTVLYGRKENVFYSLRAINQRFPFFIEKSRGEHDDAYVAFRNQAKKLINKIMEVEETNKKLLQSMRMEVANQIANLKKNKNSQKKYLLAMYQKENYGLDLVS